MKIVINFGYNGAKKEVSWYKDLMDFPKLLRFSGSKWEWIMHTGSNHEYELTFSQLPTYDPNFYVDMPSFEEMFEQYVYDKCECGSLWSSFSWDHMRFCRKWKPWNQL